VFLLGGSEGGILDAVASSFVAVTGRSNAEIALLLMGGPGWESYLPEYLDPWQRLGVTKYHIIIPDENGDLNVETTIQYLRSATGIFIGEGQTSRYLQLYAQDIISSVIRERNLDGIPVAGMSAGAKIAPEYCCFSTTPKVPDQTLTIVKGIGLVSDLIVEVHFDENPIRLDSLLDGMSQARIPHGFGIGASTCVVLENGKLSRVIGQHFYEFTMTDFDTYSYTMS
jgi:cyanophycinase